VEFIQTNEIGSKSVDGGDGGGQAAFSSDGRMYARFTPADQLFLFDFDRNEGILSHFRHVHVSDSGQIGGLAFSPNSEFLYVSSQYDLYQLDMRAVDVQNSIEHIAHYDGYFSPFPTTFFLMQLGPDCRIYMIAPNGVDVMHVIHEPDERGIACNFEQHGLQLPVYNTITLPNFPNYRLDFGPSCVGSITGLADTVESAKKIQIGPNPATRYIDLWATEEEVSIYLYNLIGQCVLSRKLNKEIDFIRVEFELANGTYVYSIVTRDGIIDSGKLVVLCEVGSCFTCPTIANPMR
jgi:hypothetical protein